MDYGLTQSQCNRIFSVFADHSEIESVIIYGSRAKGTHKTYSDIDLTIVSSTMDLTLLQKIEIELDDLMLPYKFDLSVYNKIDNVELLSHIKRVGKIFYEKT